MKQDLQKESSENSDTQKARFLGILGLCHALVLESTSSWNLELSSLLPFIHSSSQWGLGSWGSSHLVAGVRRLRHRWLKCREASFSHLTQVCEQRPAVDDVHVGHVGSNSQKRDIFSGFPSCERTTP